MDRRFMLVAGLLLAPLCVFSAGKWDVYVSKGKGYSMMIRPEWHRAPTAMYGKILKPYDNIDQFQLKMGSAIGVYRADNQKDLESYMAPFKKQSYVAFSEDTLSGLPAIRVEQEMD